MKFMLKKKLLFYSALLCIGMANAQITVSGTVTDASGMPIPGANVIEQGTSNGTATNFDGEFTIEVPSDAILEVSYLGYESLEVEVGGNTQLSIILEPSAASLEEVVVVGYGTLKKKQITTAVASVSEEDFVQGPVRSPMDLIQGKVAGLTITRQGNNPNSSPSIQLRGVTSLTGSRSPLIVIDGVPGGSLDLVQQNDIKSISVLKGGAAAAIYGTRGNAGVIIITTKKGIPGEVQFEYYTYFQREFVVEKPDYLNAAEFRDLIEQGLVSEDQDYGYSTDLYDELINEQNLSQYHNFSASGGGESTNYRASLYYNDAEGIAKQNGREEFGARLNISQTGLDDRLTLDVNIASNFNKANLLGGSDGDFEQAIQRNPTAPIRNEDGTFYETQAYNNYNPMSRLAYRIDERDQQTFSGNAGLKFEVIDGLFLGGRGSYVRNTWNDRYYRSSKDWTQREGAEYQGMGFASKDNYLHWSKNFEATIDYNTTIAEDHTISAVAGYSYLYETTETYFVNNNGFTTDAFLDWNLGAGSAINNVALPRPEMGSFKEDNTLIGFFGRVNYGFADKYFAQVIVRREGSSKFGANHKWGTFPSASVAWTITEEEFMADMQSINNLKLRIGYGITGNQGIPNYQSFVGLSTGGVYPQNGVYYQTYGASRNPNPDLKWEEKQELNIGLDFAFFDHRLSGALDVYDRLTTDLLYNYTAQQPPFVRSSIYTNVGELRSRGVELMLSAIPVQTSDFQWNVNFTGSTNSNVLEKLSNDVFQANWLEFGGLPSPGNLGNAIRLKEGWDIGNFYGKRFAGFTDDGQWLFYKADGSTGLASEMNENDLTVIGNGVPKYNASLTNTLTYRNFDLTISLHGKFGFDILNTKEMYFGNKKWLPNNLLSSALTKHDQLNDDPQYSDYYLEKGDFVKLDNITLGYNFDLKTDYIRHLRLYVSGRNLATFTGYSGLDPELEDTGFTTGIDGRGFYPRTSSWTVGLNVGF